MELMMKTRRKIKMAKKHMAMGETLEKKIMMETSALMV